MLDHRLVLKGYKRTLSACSSRLGKSTCEFGGSASATMANLYGSPTITLDVIRYPLYNFCMIRSFSCKNTQALFEGKSPRPFRSIKAAAERKLQLLDSANSLDFLRSPPGNRLEALDGDRAGQHSIRINKQWRLCFVWSNSGIYDVEIVDYH